MPPDFFSSKIESVRTGGFCFFGFRCAPFFAGFFLLFFSVAGRGVSPSPAPVVERQPDGAAVEVFLKGSEFFSWFEVAGGYLVVKDPVDGVWKYARFREDWLAVEPIEGAVVGKTDPASLPILANARPAPALLREQILKQTPGPEELPPPETAPPQQPQRPFVK